MKTLIFFLVTLFLLFVELVKAQEPLPDTVWSKRLDNVNVVKFSPDGQYVFAGVGNDIWQIDAATGDVIRTLSYHKAYVTQIGFSPTGDTIISSGWDGRIVLWNYHTGDTIEYISTLRDINKGAESDALFTTDGKRIITLTGFIGLDEPQILIIDIASKQVLKTFIGRYYMAYRLAISPDGKYFSFADFRGDKSSIILMDAFTYEEISILGYHENGIGDIKFSNDKKMIASCGGDGIVNIWDLGTKELKHTISIQGTEYHHVNKLAFSDNSNYILLANYNSEEFNKYDFIHVYNIEKGDKIYEYLFTGAGSLDVSVNDFIASCGFYANGNDFRYIFLLNPNWKNTDVFDFKNKQLKYDINNGKLIVHLPEKDTGYIDFKIYDLTGKIIKSLNEQIIYPEMKKVEIDISFLSVGVYILEINIANELYTLRFLAP